MYENLIRRLRETESRSKRALLDEAAQAIADLAELESEWVNVRDELPEIGKRVLTLDYLGHIRDRELYQFRDGSIVFYPNGLKPGRDITHWMPLPEPPKEVK